MYWIIAYLIIGLIVLYTGRHNIKEYTPDIQITFQKQGTAMGRLSGAIVLVGMTVVFWPVAMYGRISRYAQNRRQDRPDKKA